jgi:uncharacterized Zn-finger protein
MYVSMLGRDLLNVKCVLENFQKVENLKKRSWVHTKEKPYKCELCYKEFRMSSYLTRLYTMFIQDKSNINVKFTVDSLQNVDL